LGIDYQPSHTPRTNNSKINNNKKNNRTKHFGSVVLEGIEIGRDLDAIGKCCFNPTPETESTRLTIEGRSREHQPQNLKIFKCVLVRAQYSHARPPHRNLNQMQVET